MKFNQIIVLSILIGQTAFSGNPISDRPQEVQDRITEVHRELVGEEAERKWEYSGDTTYLLMGIDDERLIDWLVQSKAEEPNKTIRLLDFGSGDFSWPLNMARYIKENYLHKGIEFEIIGVTGEVSIGEEEVKANQREFAKYGIKLRLLEKTEIESIDKILEPGFDLIVSHWTLRHLVDPIGAIWRLYSLLNPNGLLLADGAYIYFDGDGPTINPEDIDHNSRMIKLLSLANADVLFGATAVMPKSFYQFMLRRKSDAPLALPISYSSDVSRVEFENSGRKYDVGAKFGTRYALAKDVNLNNVTLNLYTVEIPHVRRYVGSSDTLLQFILNNKLLGDDSSIKISNIREFIVRNKI